MARGLTPESMSNATASLAAGLNSFAARGVTHAADREQAINRIIAVAPDPKVLQRLGRIAAAADARMLDAFTHLAESGITAEQVEVIAAVMKTGGTDHG